MNLVRLTPNYVLTDFDCGDDQLNKFLFEDAKPSLVLRIANTFILEDEGRIVAYLCLLNDKVSKDEIIGSRWKKIRAHKGSVPLCYTRGLSPCAKRRIRGRQSGGREVLLVSFRFYGHR